MKNDSFRNLEEDYYRMFAIVVKDRPPIIHSADALPQDQQNPETFTPFNRHSPFSAFFVTIDESGTIITIDDLSNSITEDTAQEAVSMALSQNKIAGEINQLDLRYSTYKVDKENTTLGFVDISFEKDFISQQIINYCLIGLGSLLTFFFISQILSRMATKPIAKAWQQQQQFVADASHELKTPITVMLANTSILLSSKNEINSQDRKWISYIDLEAKQMKTLVENLLFLARTDSNETSNLYSSISLSDIIQESLLPFEAVIFESGKELQSEIDSNIFINGDSDQIKQLISILLDNAIKYTKGDTCIKVRLYQENKKAILTVNNPSEAINKEDINKIFNRFFRIDEARTRTNNSYGLGLSIAKEIVNSHNGEISLKNDNTSGTTVKVIL
jgi:signal transduction histidine kinase